MPKEQYTIRLEEPILDKCRVIAKRELRSLNNQIEWLVHEAVKDYESKNGKILTYDIIQASKSE